VHGREAVSDDGLGDRRSRPDVRRQLNAVRRGDAQPLKRFVPHALAHLEVDEALFT
jgi:hypothetical protein